MTTHFTRGRVKAAAVTLCGIAEPRPGHAGESYFTHLTVIYMGKHGYRADGNLYQLPATHTFPPSASGGA